MTKRFAGRGTLLSKAIYVLVPLAVIGMVGWLIVQNQEMIRAFPWRVHLPSLLLAAGFHSLALWVTCLVWFLFIRRLDGFRDPWLTVRIYFVSTLAKRIPTSIPYIGGRLILYRQLGVSSGAVLNSILLETLLLGIAGVICLALIWPFSAVSLPAYALPGLLIAAALLTAVMIFRFDQIRQQVNRLFRRFQVAEMQHSPGMADLFLWIGIYLLPWLAAGGSLYYAVGGLALGVSLSPVDALTISTVSTLVALLNLIVPAGFGLKELSMAALLLPWMPLSVALLFSLLYRLLHTLDDVIWALLALLIPYPAEKTQEMDETGHSQSI